MKFVFFVEGQTEKRVLPRFLKRWIDPKLSRPVGIQIVRFEGFSQFSRKITKKAQMHLDGPDSTEIVGAIGLLDLYGYHRSINRDFTDIARCYVLEKKRIEKSVNRPMFRMFFAVHELEAWLLADPNIFPSRIKQAFPGNIDHPEKINFNTPPAKLLNQLYRQQQGKCYKKIAYGSDLFMKLDPAIVCRKCPFLKAMLEELLALARNAGLEQ